jgi:hypothetical protein
LVQRIKVPAIVNYGVPKREGDIMLSVRQVMVLVCSLFISQTCFADSLEQQQRRAVNLIIRTADKICAPVPLESSSRKFELTGEGKAEIEGLLRQLVDLGIEGAATFQEEQHRGVLPQNLASVLINNTACRSEIFLELQKKLIPNISASSDLNSSQLFQYSITVQDRRTGDAIFNARVTMDLLGYAPVNLFTDSNGFARIFIEETQTGRPGSLTVQKGEYKKYVQNIDLNTNIPSHVVQLEPE